MTSFPSISVAVKSKIDVGEAAWNEKLILLYVSFNQFSIHMVRYLEFLLNGAQKLKNYVVHIFFKFKYYLVMVLIFWRFYYVVLIRVV